MSLYAQVILELKNTQVDRVFDYIVPEKLQHLIQVGVRVLLPFGYRNAKTEGYVLGVSEHTDVPQGKLKAIFEVLDEGIPLLDELHIQLARWIQDRYFCTLSHALQAMLPPGIGTKSRWYVKLLSSWREAEFSLQEKELIAFLSEAGTPQEITTLEECFGTVGNSLRFLQEKGIVQLFQQTTKSNPGRKKRLIRICENQTAYIQFLEEKEDSRFLGQKKVIEYLQEKGPSTIQDLTRALSISVSPIQTLLKRGVLQEDWEENRRDVLQDWLGLVPTTPFTPTPEQGVVLDQLRQIRRQKEKKPVLLHGVTGSGKTEVYLQVIADVLAEGKQAMVLVPEISLTPQMVERFVSRFGDLVSVTHSRLTVGERYDQWKKAQEGAISIIIGPRSALFMPFSRLGVVIIDEEHEDSYRSETTPKYDAREVARELCLMTGSLLILGSATPDINRYFEAQTGGYHLLTMKHRTSGGDLPTVFVTDMRKELEEGNRSMFGRQLLKAMEENLARKEKTMLFLNRRGYATFVSCRKCGYVMTCSNCNVSYTYHNDSKDLLCHYCGKRVENPKTCPACGSTYIKQFGSGTQKVQEEVQRIFPKATVLRMDLDTTKGKLGHKRILEEFHKGRGDILIGTQMITKGHDIPSVTLVGILAADMSLNLGSYLGGEITFRQITQAAGRAGRHSIPGRVYIQTYQPEEYAIGHAKNQDYEGFYQEEILLRKSMDYPPFSKLATFLFTGAEEGRVFDGAVAMAEIVGRMGSEAFTVLGPSPAFYSKLKKEYRFRIIIKHTDEKTLRLFVKEALTQWGKTSSSNQVLCSVTMNPGVII